MASKKLTKNLQARILQRDSNICVYCGMVATSVDHVIPRYHGGITESCNLVAACMTCNRQKYSAMDADRIEQAFRHLIHAGEPIMRTVRQYMIRDMPTWLYTDRE